MLVVGCVLLIVYVAYERYFARFPTAPLRLLKNRTFLMASACRSLRCRPPLRLPANLTAFLCAIVVIDFSQY